MRRNHSQAPTPRNIGNHRRAGPLRLHPLSPESVMLELAAIVVVTATALSFLTDATSDTVKAVRRMRRRGKVHVAAHH
jgi:hypothetical protein